MKVVAGHTNADLDALACLVAAARLYDAVPLGGNSNSPPVQRFLALHKDRFPLTAPSDIDPGEVEELILVDVRDRRRVASVHHILDAEPLVRVWDHHPDSEWDVPASEVNVEPVGACITLLVEQLRERGMTIDSDEATLYLLGLYSDTGRLSYGTVRPRDVDAAAFLLRRGASLRVVNRYLRHAMTADQSKLLVRLLDTCREVSVDHVEIALATAKLEKTVRGAAPPVQQVMELSGHDAIFAVMEFERNNRVQIIGRSRISYVDVGAILQEFGGGGHRGAGAATLKGETLQPVVDRLESLLRSTPLEPIRVESIMTTPIRFLQHDQPLGEAGERLAEWNVSGAPVERDGELVGVLSRRDVEKARKGDNLHLPVGSHMSHEVATTDAAEPIEDVLEMMTEADIGRMPVTRDGELVGIVTRTDLIRQLYMKARDDSDLQHP